MQSKIIKPKGEETSQLEHKVASALSDIESSSAEMGELLSNLFIQKVVSHTLTVGDSQEEVLLVYIPYPCLKLMRNAHEQLVPELEKHLGSTVLLTAARRIQSRWRKVHRSQKRPISRTLTHVHNAILDDLVFPSEIIGKRERYRVDGSRFYKVFLEEKYFDTLEGKRETIESLYKKLTNKQISLSFQEENHYYQIKKKF